MLTTAVGILGAKRLRSLSLSLTLTLSRPRPSKYLSDLSIDGRVQTQSVHGDCSVADVACCSVGDKHHVVRARQVIA